MDGSPFSFIGMAIRDETSSHEGTPRTPTARSARLPGKWGYDTTMNCQLYSNISTPRDQIAATTCRRVRQPELLLEVDHAVVVPWQKIDHQTATM